MVFILADDMGYGDIQAYNLESKIPTPNLNRLAEESIRFTDAHSGSAVCTPTRYGLLTGRYCWRTRLKSGVLFPPDDKPLIDQDRLTIAGMLKKYGYYSACIGKWHLGMEWGRSELDENRVDFNKPIQYGPTDTGFDEFFGIAGSLDMIPYAFYRNHTAVQRVVETQPALKFPRFIRQGPRANGFDPGRVLDELTKQAVDFIHRRARESNPFFLYFPMTAPHKPVWPAERFQGKTDLGPYGDFVAQTDWTVGRVLQALEETGAVDNTLVMYSSDNGSYMYRLSQNEPDHVQDSGVQGYHPSNHQPNGPWRGTKADIWEAGHRVPLMVRWPGRAKPGAQCDQTVCLTDVFASCSDVVGFSIPKQAGEDSFSLLPLIEGKTDRIARAPVIHHSVNGMFSLRDEKWKMVFGDGSGGREKPVGKPFREPYFLFDLEADPQETTNLIAKHPEIAQLLQEKLEAIMNSGRSR
ncbi:MAG: arylsulfatase [Candidatus Omnitrophica bacterium]|nr:arylsulfatase [Candidatus Omnitrophota bacterium]